MIIAICLILFGGAILLDIYAYRRFVSRCANAPLRMATIAVCAVTDVLPLLVIALSRGLFLFDNTQCFSDVAMWVATLYLIVVIIRFPYRRYIPIVAAARCQQQTDQQQRENAFAKPGLPGRPPDSVEAVRQQRFVSLQVIYGKGDLEMYEHISADVSHCFVPDDG